MLHGASQPCLQRVRHPRTVGEPSVGLSERNPTARILKDADGNQQFDIGAVERFVELVTLCEALPRSGSAEARQCRRNLGMIYGVDLDPLDCHRASLPDGRCVR